MAKHIVKAVIDTKMNRGRTMDKMSFQDYNLSEEIKKALDELQYITPTIIQQKVIPYVLEDRDLMVRAQTGSGKTAAFAIPLCEKINWLERKPQVLILTPTRELAVQIKEEITNIGRLKRINVTALYGKEPISVQIMDLKQRTHVIVGTPGRTFDHIARGTLVLDHIRYLVIDEADEMLNMGFLDQVEEIINELPQDRVTMLYSATLPERVEKLALKYMKTPLNIYVEETGITTSNIDHFAYEVQENNKIALLTDVTVIQNPDSCVIFCQTQERVEFVYKYLFKLNYSCDKIHGGMEQKERFDVINRFKRGNFRYLVATDILARGIDVENISLIINYDIPNKKETYVHRIGRTGRAGLTGKAITLKLPKENKVFQEIEQYIGFKIPILNAPLKDEVIDKKKAFDLKMADKPIIKNARGEQLNTQIMKLRFSGGKDKKLRATNFVGVISNIDGVVAEDIGIISVLDSLTYIEILNGKGPIVLDAMKNITIKGKLIKVMEAKHK